MGLYTFTRSPVHPFTPSMSLAKRIIPCLDVTAGRVVKGVNFVELKDAGDPVEIARRYDDQGADELTSSSPSQHKCSYR